MIVIMSTIRQSSKEAYALTTACNADAKSRKVILDFMRSYPNTDFTRAELCVNLAIPINRITPRVLELIQGGDIEELARRKSDISPVASHALKLSDRQLERMAA